MILPPPSEVSILRALAEYDGWLDAD